MGGSVLDLVAKLTLDSSSYEKGLGDAKNKGASFSKTLGTIGKVGVAAFTAVGAATVAIGKQAVDAYASYEQLWGGVQKLYGSSAETVLKNAEQAFRTSGANINDYMQQATTLSAALINSLGGDTQKAADQTDVAMRAISDNYNTFGGDLQNVAGVFQALSKQQYQTLDNLKLGYAGTKSGMEQLIKDANEWGAANGKASDLSIDSFSDVVTAIDYIQQKMGIAGTTTKEALTTIEGAGNATRAAWANVVAAIGKGEGLGDALKGLSESLFGIGLTDEGEETGLLNQLIPRIKTTMESIGDFVVESAPLITEKIPEVLSAIVPAVFETITQLTASMSQFIFEKLPEFLAMGVEMINGLASGLAEGVPNFLSKALPMLLSFTESLRTNIGLIVDAGINLIMNFVKGIVKALPDLIKYVPTIVENIAGIINDNMPKILKMGVDIIVTLGEGIINSIPVIVSNFGNIVKAIFSVVQAVNWVNLGSKVVKLVANGIKALFNLPVEIFRNIGRSIIDTFQHGFSWSSLGQNIVNGIINGIKSFGSGIKNTLLGFASDAWRGVKSFFGIASPSKLMRDTIGKFIPLGIAEGIEDTADSVYDAMDDLSNATADSYDTVFDDISSSRLNDLGGSNVNYGGLVFNIYGAEGQNPEEIALAVRDIIVSEEERNKLVYA